MPSNGEEIQLFMGGGAVDHPHQYSRFRSLAPQKLAIFFHLFLLTLNISLLIYGTRLTSIHANPLRTGAAGEDVFSPVQSVITYTTEEMHYSHRPSQFTGDPRPEVDQAWSNLLRSTMVRVSEEEMKRMNKKSVVLRDGSGYVGYLESHHMLHCVKRLYQYQYPERYPKLKSNGLFSKAHWDHCLDVLREGIMCNADITMNTFFWESDVKIKGDRSGIRKCVNWDRIQAWADERALNASDKRSFMSTLIPKQEPSSIGPVN